MLSGALRATWNDASVARQGNTSEREAQGSDVGVCDNISIVEPY